MLLVIAIGGGRSSSSSSPEGPGVGGKLGVGGPGDGAGVGAGEGAGVGTGVGSTRPQRAASTSQVRQLHTLFNVQLHEKKPALMLAVRLGHSLALSLVTHVFVAQHQAPGGRLFRQ
jgi:hypothetical protein